MQELSLLLDHGFEGELEFGDFAAILKRDGKPMQISPLALVPLTALIAGWENAALCEDNGYSKLLA